MAAQRSPDHQRRASVTMYDPARDIYTVSDESTAARFGESNEIHPEQSQEHQLDATANASPGSGQGTSPGAVGHGVSVQSSTSIVTSPSSLKPSRPGRNATSGETKLSETGVSSVDNNPALPSSNSAMAASPSRSSPPLDAPESTENSDKRSLPTKTSVTMQDKDMHNITDMHASSGARNGPAEPRGSQERLNTAAHTHIENKKRTEDAAKTEDAKPDQDQPRSKRKRQPERVQQNKKRAKAAPSAYSRRDISPSVGQNEARQSSSPRRRSPGFRQGDTTSKRPRSPSPIRRSPSPEAAPSARQRKRPGGGARVSTANVEALKRRQEERDRQQEEEAKRVLFDRGVHDVVRQHYNAVPERGREWRKTDSKIKGLRSFNNWVKSTIIQKFSPDEDFLARTNESSWASEGAPPVEEEEKKLLILDFGCGKGGDLGKWNQAPQPVDLYVGLDPANISIEQARDRYQGMRNPRNRGPRRGANPLFHAEFYPKDCFGEWLGDVPIIQRVGIDGNVGPEGSLMASRWGGGGFDVAVSMFAIHYAFETEEKARQMLRNVAGVLKKGGRFMGVSPNSDVISAKVAEFHQKKKAQEAAAKENQGDREDGEVDDIATTPEWGNDLYRVRFHGDTPEDGIFRPPFGWKYSYFMEEAVEEIPEYVVPWEAFRALTEDYNLELQYRKPFVDIWHEEKDDPVLGPLSERMGVRSRSDGSMLVNDEELEAASFYHAFCFYKV